MFNKEDIKIINYHEFTDKVLTMKYLEDEEGYGLLYGKDSEGNIYILKEVIPSK